MGTVEPPSTNTPWSAAQHPSTGTEKISTMMRISFFQTCCSKDLYFLHQALFDFSFPEKFIPECRRLVENVWNSPQHGDSARVKGRMQEEEGVGKERTSRTNQTEKWFFLLPKNICAVSGAAGRQGQVRTASNFKWQQWQVTLQKQRNGSTKSTLVQFVIPHKYHSSTSC